MQAKYLKAIYACGNKYGLTEQNNKNDDLHAIVFKLTGKASIRQLSDTEAVTVLKELAKLEPAGKGKMTAAQIKKAWAVYYELKAITPGPASDGERMCGIIKKVTNVSASAKNPFAWINFDDGEKVIEYLKRYLKSAKKRTE